MLLLVHGSIVVFTAALLRLVPSVAAHGEINHVVAGGSTNDGPNIYYSGDSKNKKTVTRVMYKASSPSYVLYTGFNDDTQMSCEGSYNSPAPDVLSVQAGDVVQVFWEGATGELLNKPGTGGLTAYNPWVHAMGPVQDYITSCNGDCSSFNSQNAGWTKIAGSGIDMSTSISSDLRATMKGKPEEYYPTSGNGLWAMAKLVQDGSKWDITVPSSLKNGQYILRHELSAVHNPKQSGDATTGPQLYISCIQIEVTNGGSTSLPAGTKASDLYDPNGDFANFNVYSDDVSSFKLPGPAVWDGASSSTASSSNPSPSSSTKKSTSTPTSSTKKTTAPSTSTKVITSASTPTSVATTSATGAATIISSSAPASNSTGACRKRKRSARRVPRVHRRLAVSH